MLTTRRNIHLSRPRSIDQAIKENYKPGEKGPQCLQKDGKCVVRLNFKWYQTWTQLCVANGNTGAKLLCCIRLVEMSMHISQDTFIVYLPFVLKNIRSFYEWWFGTNLFVFVVTTGMKILYSTAHDSLQFKLVEPNLEDNKISITGDKLLVCI